jgi:hypothetical protein
MTLPRPEQRLDECVTDEGYITFHLVKEMIIADRKAVAQELRQILANTGTEHVDSKLDVESQLAELRFELIELAKQLEGEKVKQ